MKTDFDWLEQVHPIFYWQAQDLIGEQNTTSVCVLLVFPSHKRGYGIC